MELSVAKTLRKGDYVRWSRKNDQYHCNADERFGCADGLTELLEDPRVLEDGLGTVLFKVMAPASDYPSEYSYLWFEEATESELAALKDDLAASS